MKVLCIDGTSANEVITHGERKGQKPRRHHYVFDNAIYTVLRVVAAKGKDWYVLKQIGPFVGYEPARFIPLDGPCEIEIAETRIEEDAREYDRQFAEIIHQAENAI